MSALTLEMNFNSFKVLKKNLLFVFFASCGALCSSVEPNLEESGSNMDKHRLSVVLLCALTLVG